MHQNQKVLKSLNLHKLEALLYLLYA